MDEKISSDTRTGLGYFKKARFVKDLGRIAACYCFLYLAFRPRKEVKPWAAPTFKD